MTRFILKWATTLFICFVAFSIVYPLWFKISTNYYDVNGHCTSNQKQIGLAMLMYSEDYDGRLPPAIFHDKTVGWANGLQPYLKSYSIFQCPAEENPSQKFPQPGKPGFTDYWMNRNLSGVIDKKINNPDKIIMLGDGDGGSPDSTASYAINELPIEWRRSPDSPAERHLDGAYYTFLDGHVKWLEPEQIAQVPPLKKRKIYTFLIK